ncbi:uncharacterized protein LOC128884407 isoform X2 [Hylaeus volcanicus]|uniref:uncharacterized protein LOC128884407 isoform X2 n=1 Tax=Hylaeus volcanicus TaxID=313075 RepID=UPI0023B7FAD6|nr:uncharacterized protein LOC128884407 isoform X2 [Hylaeus volcanicus]
MSELDHKIDSFKTIVSYVEQSKNKKHKTLSGRKKKNVKVIDKVTKNSNKENKIRKKTKKNDSFNSIINLLENEIQPYYDPTAGQQSLTSGIRHRRDHLNRQIKNGPYTQEEHDILKASLENYFKLQGWNEQECWNHITSFGEGSGRSSKQKEVVEAQHWEKIAMALPQRSVRSVQLFALRRLYPWKTGPWTKEEENDLIELVKRYGFTWTKFAYEYFQRPPNYIQSKWRDLEPRLCEPQHVGTSKRHRWTKEEDIKLLKAINLVTGVPLPYRAVPWREVQEHMPNFSPCALSWRYKNTLFPSIIEGMFKGAKERVLFRQYLRYVKSGLQSGLIKDLSEVEGKRVVPFWYSSNHQRRFTQYLKASCSPEIQNSSLTTQINYLYNKLKCDKKEKHDLRRLSESYEMLKKINGVIEVPATPGVLSQRYKNPFAHKSNVSSNEKQKNLPSRNLFVTVTKNNTEKQTKSILRPLTAKMEKIQNIVPPHLHHVPEAFPIYLEAKKRKQRKEKQHCLSQQISTQSVTHGKSTKIKIVHD